MDEVRVLGDCRLIKQIGHGSFGALYLGEHRFTKKRYALKVLPEELAQDKAFCARFEEEIASIASLQHPNIVKTYNVSFSQGAYFLTEDFIVDSRGESVNLWDFFCAENKNLKEDTILFIATQLAAALDWAHERKIVHRSFKWNNILVGAPLQPDLPFHLYISDFGLSKLIGIGAALTRSFAACARALSTDLHAACDHYPSPAIDPQSLSALHFSFLQNFSFLAPEQKRADVAVGAAADVYAFGVLIYCLLTGVYPEGCFVLPSKIRKEMSCNWDLVVTECLQPDPDKRVKELQDVLQRASNQMHVCDVAKDQFAQAGVAVLKEMLHKEEPAMLAALHAVETHQFDLFPQIQSQGSSSILPNLERVVKEYHPEKREVRIVNPILTEMILVPQDEYYRGSNHGCRDEMPRHALKLPSFAIDMHPVTNEQFVRFLEAIGEEKDAHNHDIIRLRESRIKKSAGKYSVEPGYAKHPVVGVTWYGASAYARWIGRRLPTEAEWEVACCGGLENPLYPTGETIEKTQANFFSSDTTGVMSYPPNGYGLYDMCGNVYEWCQDWYEYNSYEAASQEPGMITGPSQGVYRVLRGGCWKSLKEDLRCTKRHRNNPGVANGTYGFRCAANL